jgi:hypothetical protein
MKVMMRRLLPLPLMLHRHHPLHLLHPYTPMPHG